LTRKHIFLTQVKMQNMGMVCQLRRSEYTNAPRRIRKAEQRISLFGKELNDQLTFIVFRAVKSLVKCRAQGFSDIKFKAVTGVNIIKKVFNNIPVKVRVDFTPWVFKDTVVKVDFRSIEYMFNCPFQCDSNIFLNPYYHEYDVPVIAATVLRRGDTFIDVGAHCGLYTLLAGKVVGTQGTVIAIEPNPSNLELLKANIALNRLNNVIVVSKAAADKTSAIDIYFDSGKTAFSSAFRCADHVVRVETAELDEIAEAHNSIKLLKIDTEGFDLNVLKGAKETLKKTAFLVVEQTGVEVQKLLVQQGFDLFLLSASRNLLAINKKIRLSPDLSQLTSRVELV